MKLFQLFFSLILFFPLNAKSGILKSVIYDFDGFDAGQTDFPEGDYKVNDLTYQSVVNPLGNSDMLGDRVLQVNLNWNIGNGAFGRGISRFVEFDAAHDVFNFYFYNPAFNVSDALLDVVISEDDDNSNHFSIANDDVWMKSLSLPVSEHWQHVSIPLSEFTDSNAGGNGVFDCGFENGMLLFVEFRFRKKTTANQIFFLDMIAFSEGELPHGASALDLPGLSMQGKCPLGAYEKKEMGQQFTIPSEIQGFFSPAKKIKYVNWFLQWAMDGSTVAKELPGDEVTKLLASGYTPVITWEALYKGFSRLDPVQPRLNNILNGEFDSYINSFADKIRSYNDTIIIRFMHEFEGDWYPWSITYNNNNPANYISAFRKVVDMFRARGASKVKWMWCVNSDYAPYANYNWIVKAYPGDNYVDIVATDIYNNHFPVDYPWWFSFRYKAAESYYYLTKYFPHKPLLICEAGCRERRTDEDPFSETKPQWIARMDKELHSDFSHVKGLIFFSENAECDWRINSSNEALNSIENNIWEDDYYFEENTDNHIHNLDYADGGFIIYPNPTTGLFTLEYCFHGEDEGVVNVEIINSTGEIIFQKQLIKTNACGREMIGLDKTIPRGIYTINVTAEGKKESKRVILSYDTKTKRSEICVARSLR